jgi:outer membrane lipoprotein LolB
MVAGLKSLTTWQADGVFSFESSNQVGMAHFRVDVTPYTWRVQISSALNIAQMTIGSDALGVWYTDQHGHIQHAQSLESVMRAQFGFALPMLALQDWMKGLAASDQAIQTLNAFNQLQQLEEDGWTLAYSNYGLYHNLTLPGMIVMMGNDQKIKMVIDKWR